MLLEFGDIIDLVINHEPQIVVACMLLDFFPHVHGLPVGFLVLAYHAFAACSWSVDFHLI